MMKESPESIVPYDTQDSKTAQVERMFDSIAGKYDLLNRTLSFGIDIYWRNTGIRYLKPYQPEQVLDIATGTGDLAITLYRKLSPKKVTGIDLSENMMEVGRKKVADAGFSSFIFFEQEDCLALSYEDNSFDAVTAAFGIRNFENILTGLKEMHRVLKPGGRLMILELSTPEAFPIKQLYTLYSKIVIPHIGRLFSKEKSAYNYLPASIKVVPQGKEMVALLDKAGFKETVAKKMTFGICSMYTGKK